MIRTCHKFPSICGSHREIANIRTRKMKKIIDAQNSKIVGKEN